jgi:hypothetical protein
MNDDWPATSSYGKPYARWLIAWSCQNFAYQFAGDAW